MRLGALFIGICMAIIAASAGAVVYLYLNVTLLAAATVAVATFVALALYHTISSRVGLRSAIGRQLADLSRGGANVARQVAEMGRRLAALEDKIETALDQARAATDPLSAEIAELGTVVKQLAERVDAQQAMVEALARRPSKSEGALAASATERTAEFRNSISPDRIHNEEATVAAKLPTDLAVIRDAIDGNRIDIYLQPIVTLPQRKVRYYEARSRLRNERDEAFHASAFIAQAESCGLMPKIDNLVLFRCVQLVRRLLQKNRDIGIFCNVSAKTLTDAIVLPQLIEFLTANRAIAPSLVLQFSQSAISAMGPPEYEGLAALSARGFKFSVDRVTGLRLDTAELANRGFRYVKVHANLLLRPPRPVPTDMRPAELSDRLGRSGIDLIVDRIEDERSVIDLLDCDVSFGQGELFSPPRAVRPEALQKEPDVSDAGAGERIAYAGEATLAHSSAVKDNASDAATNAAQPSTVAELACDAAANG